MIEKDSMQYLRSAILETERIESFSNYTNADIYQLTDRFEKVSYEDTDKYNVTKAFLNKTDKILKILMD